MNHNLEGDSMVTDRYFGGRAKMCILTCFAVAALAFTAFSQTDAAKEAYNQGLAAQQAKNPEAAIAAYKQAIEADPNFYDAYLNLGVVYFGMGNLDEAMKSFQAAAEKKPENTEAFMNLGKVQSAAKRYPEAIQAFDGALKNAPAAVDSVGLYKEIAKVHSKSSNHTEVIATVEKVHAMNAADNETWYTLGKAYEKLKKTKEAMEAYEKSLAASEVNALAHFALGTLYLQAENYPKASDQFKSALEDDPKNFRAAYNFAIAAEAMSPDSSEQNITNWQQFIRLAKNQPKAKDDLTVAQQHVKELQNAKAAN